MESLGSQGRTRGLTMEMEEGRVLSDHQPAPARRGGVIRGIIITLVVVAVLLGLALVGFIVLSGTSAFTIAYIDTEDTEHLTREDIAKLADVEEGTTLLRLDEEAVTANLKRNPWVADVSYVREFPDRLQIVVTERQVDALVKMSTGSVCWCMGDDSVWVEPVNLTVAEGQSADEAALAMARRMDVLLISDAPASLSPSAGEAVDDEALMAVQQYRQELSSDFASQIVSYTAQNVESVGCTLSNGVEVSLGAPTNIDVKEELVREILAKHPNQITYINVRVTSQPTYRRVGVESVSEGSGIQADENALAPEDAGTAGPDLSTLTTTDQNATQQQTVDGTTTTADPTQQQTGDGTQQPADGTQMTGDGTQMTGDGSATQDNSELILGGDGNYYTYEEYWGIE